MIALICSITNFIKYKSELGGSYIDSYIGLDKNKKATINPVNDGDKCFQYDKTVALIKLWKK